MATRDWKSESVTNGQTDGPTNLLTWVGARDTGVPENTARAQRMLNENEVKISKKTQNGQKSLFEGRFGFMRCLFGGFGD